MFIENKRPFPTETAAELSRARKEFIREAAIEFAVKCFDVKDGSTLPPRCWEAAEHLWRCKPEDD